MTFEVDGPDAGPAGRWGGLDDFLAVHGRWLLGGGDGGGAYVEVTREGRTAAVSVELTPDRAPPGTGGEPPELVVLPPADAAGDGADPFSPDLSWDGPATLFARFDLDRTGTYRTLLRWPGGATARGPAVSLPYSPEFLPRSGLPTGGAVLEELAAISGGSRRLDVTTVFADPPPRPAPRPLWAWLAAAGVGLLLVEIAGRRWRWALPWRAAGEVVAPVRTADRRPPPRPREEVPAPTVDAPAPARRPAANADDVFGAAKRRAGRRT